MESWIGQMLSRHRVTQALDDSGTNGDRGDTRLSYLTGSPCSSLSQWAACARYRVHISRCSTGLDPQATPRGALGKWRARIIPRRDTGASWVGDRLFGAPTRGLAGVGQTVDLPVASGFRIVLVPRLLASRRCAESSGDADCLKAKPCNGERMRPKRMTGLLHTTEY
jgi:hypothetical protein